MSTQPQAPPEAPPPHAPPRRPPGAGVVLIGLAMIAAGAIWLAAALGVEIPVAIVTPAVLVVLGLAVLVSAVRGEDHGAIGLAIFVGVVLAVGAIATTVVDVPLTGAVGDHEIAPATAAELEAADTRLFAGSQVLDLRDLELPEGTTEVSLSTVLGEVAVIVPEGMAVRVDVAVGAGSMDVYGDVVEGVGLDDVVEGAAWDDAPRRIDLELRVGLGEVRVRRG